MGHFTIEAGAVTPRARALLGDALVWDNHTATAVHAGRRDSLLHLERHRAAGVDVVCVNAGFDAVAPETTLFLLAEFRGWLREHPGYALVGTADDVVRARAAGRTSVCFNIEGGNALLGRASLVSLYYDLGVRWMLFAYNRNNALAGGCQDDDHGLTDFGREVLGEMERVGMVVCCSHVGPRSAAELLERATRPAIFSHSNPAALHGHARNIGDGLIRKCARGGGVIGINGIGIFLGENDASPELIVRNVDYVASLVGVDHVGLALDYAFDAAEVQAFVKAHPEQYPPAKYPNGIAMAPPECFPELAERLLRSGHSETDVKKVLGGNHLRIAREVWK